ncbi:MAG: NnrU family protein [Myxococcota bacterium]|jgi:uncharacterized membrane protein|nr:NnrU family protein [Myxococcota bacterium]
MSIATQIVLLWLLFAATHMTLSSRRLRPRLVAALGERGFLGVYSLVAITIFVALVWRYWAHRHAGALLYTPPALGVAGLWTLYVLQGVAWTLVVAGNVSPSPVTVGLPEARRAKQARGVHRITRHPLFMGVGLFGALHLLVMGFASDVAFFAGFPLFAILGCAHQDRRKLATEGPAYRAWHAGTPFLPFTGRDTLRGLREIPPLAIGIGIATTVLLRWLHGPLFR